MTIKLSKRAKIEREVLRVIMESPLYFTVPLQKKRLEFIMFFSQQSVYQRFCACNEPPDEGES